VDHQVGTAGRPDGRTAGRPADRGWSPTPSTGCSPPSRPRHDLVGQGAREPTASGEELLVLLRDVLDRLTAR